MATAAAELERHWHQAGGQVRRLCLEVGGLAVAATSTAPDLWPRVSGAARRFLVEPRVPDLELEVAWGAAGTELVEPPLFDSGGVWRLRREKGDLVFTFRSAAHPGRPYRSARLHPGLRHGEVLLDRAFYRTGEPVDPLEYPLNELLFVHLLAQGRGVELHACGVTTASGAGLLFAGRSGDGKTTLARLWQALAGVTVLSDDRVVVRRGASGPELHGTPWHGDAELSTKASAPLQALFLLEHGARTEPLPLAPAAAAAELLARSFVPFYDRTAVEQTLAFLRTLVAEVPCYRLPFVPEASALQLVLARVG